MSTRSAFAAAFGAVAIIYRSVSLMSPTKRRVVGLVVLLSLIALSIFATTRHVQIVGRRKSAKRRATRLDRSRATRSPSDDYNIFVLGSGGHTKEMLMMMDDGFCDFGNGHRRYLISSGDAMSDNHLEDYESDLKLLCAKHACSPGTYDKKIVNRARHVYQPLWATPYTALLSILDIFPVLLEPPDTVEARNVDYPRRIYSNGPATGFFVGLAAHLLKMFYYVPEDTMHFVYVESWARISTLSLTGKLLYHTGIADVFVVQHEPVAARYGLQNAGEMVFNSRRPDS